MTKHAVFDLRDAAVRCSARLRHNRAWRVRHSVRMGVGLWRGHGAVDGSV